MPGLLFPPVLRVRNIGDGGDGFNAVVVTAALLLPEMAFAPGEGTTKLV